MKRFQLSDFLYHFLLTLFTFPKAWHFIREKRLWVGFNEYNWVIKGVIVAGIFFGLRLGGVFLDWLTHFKADSPLALASTLGGLVTNLGSEGYHLFTAGYMKYIILILMQVVVYHFMRHTLTALVGRAGGATFDDFLKSQIRAFKVGIQSWILELIASVMIAVAFGIVGLDWLEPAAKFAVQCYFLGFMILDNYNELMGMSIKESEKYTRQYAGVALALGLPLYVMLLVPLAGAVLGPIVTAVVGGMVMVRVSEPLAKNLAQP